MDIHQGQAHRNDSRIIPHSSFTLAFFAYIIPPTSNVYIYNRTAFLRSYRLHAASNFLFVVYFFLIAGFGKATFGKYHLFGVLIESFEYNV
jgi:hypothetical protein